MAVNIPRDERNQDKESKRHPRNTERAINAGNEKEKLSIQLRQHIRKETTEDRFHRCSRELSPPIQTDFDSVSFVGVT